MHFALLNTSVESSAAAGTPRAHSQAGRTTRAHSQRLVVVHLGQADSRRLVGHPEQTDSHRLVGQGLLLLLLLRLPCLVDPRVLQQGPGIRPQLRILRHHHQQQRQWQRQHRQQEHQHHNHHQQQQWQRNHAHRLSANSCFFSLVVNIPLGPIWMVWLKELQQYSALVSDPCVAKKFRCMLLPCEQYTSTCNMQFEAR